MTDIEELKKRLRKTCGRTIGHGCSCSDGWECSACAEKKKAADAIEQLQRELEEARKDAERYRIIRDRWHVQFKEGALQNLNCVVSEKWGARLDGDLDAIMQGRPTSVDAARQQQG